MTPFLAGPISKPMPIAMTIFDGSSDASLDLLPWGYDSLVAAERARRSRMRNR